MIRLTDAPIHHFDLLPQTRKLGTSADELVSTIAGTSPGGSIHVGTFDRALDQGSTSFQAGFVLCVSTAILPGSLGGLKRAGGGKIRCYYLNKLTRCIL